MCEVPWPLRAMGVRDGRDDESVVVEVRRCVKKFIALAEMPTEESFGDSMAMARWTTGQRTESARSMLSSERRAPGVEAEEEDDGGIACGGTDAEEES